MYFTIDEEKPDIKAAFERAKPRAAPAAAAEPTTAHASPDRNRKQVSVADFFGGGSIHRVESKTSGSTSNKRKAVSLNSLNDTLFITAHM